jgi:hypothetical protein
MYGRAEISFSLLVIAASGDRRLKIYVVALFLRL